MNTNATVDQTFLRPTQWDETTASQYTVGKVIDTSTWNIDDFTTVNMYIAWTAVCACHNTPVRSCLNNPTINFKAEDWSKYLKKNTVSSIKSETTDDIEYIQKPPRRKNIPVTNDILDTAISMFKEKGVVATAYELRVLPQELSKRLKEAGYTIHKGKKKSITEMPLTV